MLTFLTHHRPRSIGGRAPMEMYHPLIRSAIDVVLLVKDLPLVPAPVPTVLKDVSNRGSESTSLSPPVRTGLRVNAGFARFAVCGVSGGIDTEACLLRDDRVPSASVSSSVSWL